MEGSVWYYFVFLYMTVYGKQAKNSIFRSSRRSSLSRSIFKAFYWPLWTLKSSSMGKTASYGRNLDIVYFWSCGIKELRS